MTMMHRMAKIPIMTKTAAIAYAGIQRFVKGERKSKSGMIAPAVSSTPRKFKHRFWFHSKQNLVLVQIPDKIKIDTLNLKSINGKIETNSVKIANANISVQNGIIKLIDSQIDQISASSTNGRCYSIGNTIKVLDFRTINGLVSVDSGDVTNIKLHAVNGKVKATGLPGKITDYNINCRTVNGNVYLNGNKVSSRGSYKSLSTGNRSIDIDTVNGKIKIDTKIK